MLNAKLDSELECISLVIRNLSLDIFWFLSPIDLAR